MERKKNTRGIFKKLTATTVTLCFLAGCSTHSENIGAAYVSPLQYNDHSCNQIRQELVRVNHKVLEVSGRQDSEATKDAVALGVGLLLFWPALFFMIGADKKEELARLKGEYEALEQVAIQKECNAAMELAEVRKQREKYRKDKNTAPDESGDGASGI